MDASWHGRRRVGADTVLSGNDATQAGVSEECGGWEARRRFNNEVRRTRAGIVGEDEWVGGIPKQSAQTLRCAQAGKWGEQVGARIGLARSTSRVHE